MAFFDEFNKAAFDEAVQMQNKLRINLENQGEIKRPDFKIEIDGKGLAVEGEHIEIYGEIKSKKSSLAHMIAASFMQYDGIYENICNFIDPKKVLMIRDTEQSSTKVNVDAQRLLLMSDEPYIRDNIDICSTTFFNAPMKCQLLFNDILKYKHDLGLVVLDVISNYVYSTNDEAQARDFFQAYKELQAEYGFISIGTMHKNATSNKSQGSFGSESNKYAAYIIQTHFQGLKKPAKVTTHRDRWGETFDEFEIEHHKNITRVVKKKK